MRAIGWTTCIVWIALLSCHEERGAPTADPLSEGGEYAADPLDGEMDPLHPVDPYPIGTPGVSADVTSGGAGGMGGLGGMGASGGSGGMGGLGGRGGMGASGGAGGMID